MHAFCLSGGLLKHLLFAQTLANITGNEDFNKLLSFSACNSANGFLSQVGFLISWKKGGIDGRIHGGYRVFQLDICLRN